MMILFTAVFSLAMWSNAAPFHPLYASYCAALLESRPLNGTVAREAVIQSLDQFSVRAAASFESFWTAAPANVRHVVDQNRRGSELKPLRVRDASVPTSGRSGLIDDLDALRNEGERIGQIRGDVDTIRDGVVAVGFAIRGQNHILSYFDEVMATTARNEGKLRPIYDAAHPFVTTGRVFFHSYLLALPSLAYGGLAWWTIPPLLRLESTAIQLITLSIALPAAYFVYRALELISWPYLKGLLAPKYRDQYEKLHGKYNFPSKIERLETLRDFVANAPDQPNALVHLFDECVLSEDDVTELKSAAAEGRAPSLALANRQEPQIRGNRPQGLPVSFRFKMDYLYFVDETTDEPVLMVFSRFVRNFAAPRKPKRDSQGDAVTNLGLGGLIPNAR